MKFESLKMNIKTLVFCFLTPVFCLLSAGTCGLGYEIHSTKEYVRNYKQIMQNKPNFPHFSTKNKDYAKKQTQFKPNFGPISRVAKPNKPKFLPPFPECRAF